MQLYDDGVNGDKDKEVCVVAPHLPPMVAKNTADDNPLPVDEVECPDVVQGTDKPSDPQWDVSLAVGEGKRLSPLLENQPSSNKLLSVEEKITPYKTPSA